MATTTTAIRDSWFKSAIGRKINPDRWAGFQCKDVNDDYGMHLYGTALGVAIPLGNAGTIFGRLSTKYWKSIKNNSNDPNHLPQKGDMIFWAGSAKNLWWGHCAVVEKADKNGVTVIQQDGLLQSAAHRKYIPWKGNLPQGWARPNYKATAQTTKYHTVKKGETLSGIAVKYKTTWQALQKLNGIKNANVINTNQKIRIK